MSVRYFCDSCGVELSPEDHGRLKVRNGRVDVEVIHCLDGTWNAGNICHKCIRHTVEHGHAITSHERQGK